MLSHWLPMNSMTEADPKVLIGGGTQRTALLGAEWQPPGCQFFRFPVGQTLSFLWALLWQLLTGLVITTTCISKYRLSELEMSLGIISFYILRNWDLGGVGGWVIQDGTASWWQSQDWNPSVLTLNSGLRLTLRKGWSFWKMSGGSVFT